jgi:hypothetical protein
LDNADDNTSGVTVQEMRSTVTDAAVKVKVKSAAGNVSMVKDHSVVQKGKYYK